MRFIIDLGEGVVSLGGRRGRMYQKRNGGEAEKEKKICFWVNEKEWGGGGYKGKRVNIIIIIIILGISRSVELKYKHGALV